MTNKRFFLIAALSFYSVLFSACQGSAGVEKSSMTAGLGGLDILKDYDKDLWSGPAGWDEKQWHWKKLLKWDRYCDYVGEVEEYAINGQYQLITVQCVPGAYQPVYYLFLFNETTKESKQLKLGFPESTDNPKEVIGSISVDSAAMQMSILTLSRGIGDCGTYRVFGFYGTEKMESTLFQLEEVRRQECKDLSSENIQELPEELLDYKKWPKVR